MPVQRSKIAQNLKKTLETRRSQSLAETEAAAPALCEADAARMAQLRAEIAGLKRELEAERRSHAKALETEKRRLQSAVAELQREKEQALQKVTDSLKREHEETLRAVKNKQWCAQCNGIAHYYCCWNTSYCSVECQNFHWQQHMSTCQQQQHRPPTDGRVA